MKIKSSDISREEKKTDEMAVRDIVSGKKGCASRAGGTVTGR